MNRNFIHSIREHYIAWILGVIFTFIVGLTTFIVNYIGIRKDMEILCDDVFFGKILLYTNTCNNSSSEKIKSKQDPKDTPDQIPARERLDTRQNTNISESTVRDTFLDKKRTFNNIIPNIKIISDVDWRLENSSVDNYMKKLGVFNGNWTSKDPGFKSFKFIKDRNLARFSMEIGHGCMVEGQLYALDPNLFSITFIFRSIISKGSCAPFSGLNQVEFIQVNDYVAKLTTQTRDGPLTTEIRKTIQ